MKRVLFLPALLAAMMLLVAALEATHAQAQRRAQVSVRRLRVDGAVSRASVQRAIEASLPEIRRCITGRLAEREGLAGELRVRVFIAGDGVALAAQVDWSSVEDRPLQRCVTERAQQWSFEETGRPTEIHFRVRVGAGPVGDGRNIREQLQEGASPPAPPTDEARAHAVLVVEDGSVVLRGITLDEVRAELESRHRSVTRCIEQHATAFVHRGVITIDWRLRANGRVAGRPTARVTGTLPEAARVCVARTARRFRFPAAGASQSGERRVTISLRVDWER